MKRTGLIVTIILALVAFVCGFGGVSAGLYLTQPASSARNQVLFVVHDGDTSTEVANNLQARGLIRNTLAFKLLAKIRHANGFDKGTYTLYTNMTMDQIIKTLLAGAQAVEVTITIPPGWRVSQYPSVFTKALSNFNADNFMKIVTTGKYLDGTTVNEKYWFVPKIQPNVKFALEGYLFPDTYNFYADADETAVINRLLVAFGEQLCPGPDAAHADAY
ncbi:MAG TPA: endolytic transglycosylase MltG, partial [Ktedonobacterales bacterium]